MHRLSFTPEHSRGAPVEILPAEPEAYAAALYGALHRLDDAGCREIFVAQFEHLGLRIAVGVLRPKPQPPGTSAWRAVRDRLARDAASE